MASCWAVTLLFSVVVAQREKPPSLPVEKRTNQLFSGFHSQTQHHGYGGGGAGYPLVDPPFVDGPYLAGGHGTLPLPPPQYGHPHQQSPGPLVLVQPEKIILTCLVKGYTHAPVQWLKPDGPGLVAENDLVLWDRQHFTVETSVYGGGRGSRLIISYPRPRHLGTYLCRAGPAAADAFTVGRRADHGFSPVYHSRNGGSDRIQAEEPQQLDRTADDNEPLTKLEEKKILEEIAREIEEAEKDI